MDDKGSKYYYSRLADNEKDIYNRICEALLRFEPTLSVEGASSTDMQKILNAVLFDNPVFFYLNSRSVMIARSPFGLQLMFRYDYTKSEADAMWQTAQSKIDEFMKCFPIACVMIFVDVIVTGQITSSEFSSKYL